jgi:hypothetical protein
MPTPESFSVLLPENFKNVDLNDCTFNPELSELDSLMWMLSFIAVELAYTARGRLAVEPVAVEPLEQPSTPFHIKLSDEMLRMLQEIMNGKDVKIGQYLQNGIFIHYNKDTGRFSLVFRLSPIYEEILLQGNLKVIQKNLRAVVELGLRGSVAWAHFDEASGAVEFCFVDGSTVVINASHRDHEVFRNIALGIPVLIGEEMGGNAYYRQDIGFISEKTGRRHPDEESLWLDPHVADAIRLVKQVRKYKIPKGDDFGKATLYLKDGTTVILEEARDYIFYSTVTKILQGKSAIVGRVPSGFEAHFDRFRGVVIQNKEQRPESLPKPLRRFPELQVFTPGSYWFGNREGTKFSQITSNPAETDLDVVEGHPLYETLRKLVYQHQYGILCEKSAGQIDDDQRCTVYVFHHGEDGITINIHPGRIHNCIVEVDGLDRFYDGVVDIFTLDRGTQGMMVAQPVYASAAELGLQLKRERRQNHLLEKKAKEDAKMQANIERQKQRPKHKAGQKESFKHQKTNSRNGKNTPQSDAGHHPN